MNDFLNSKFNLYFDVCDRNNDGYITEEDYVGHVNRLAELRGISLDDPQIVSDRADMAAWWVQFQQSADTNNDGKITRDEFIQFWMQLAMGAQADIQQAQQIRESLSQSALSTFKILDADNDGQVSLEEYTHYIQSYEHNIDYTEAFNKLTNGKDTLSGDDVVEIVVDFICNTDASVRGNYLFGSVN